MFNPVTGKVHVTRDVKFDEKKGWNWEETSKEGRVKDNTWTSFVVQSRQDETGVEGPKDNNDEQRNPEDHEHLDTESEWSSPDSTIKGRGSILPREAEDQDQPYDPSIAIEETYDDTPVRGLKALEELDDADLMLVDNDPKNYLEARAVKEWQEAITSTERNQT
ncbi:hypothetical protein E3N88_15491 [Mikania micrantha]|uniref:Retroviral polymerase SH3-like domain-containing protein n=1 Tax=Mikania micrantha TaxID=192012 RepID=A0A5N6NXD6_9ASTR|nr:hypothetical protein E3N88_15491 [Mikania micrantha]